MTLIQRLKRWSTFSRLRRQVRTSPTPAAFGELAERLVALGEIDRALAAAEEGLAQFPDSERLDQVRTFAMKSRLSVEIRRLAEDIRRRPTPIAYGRLAEIYRDLGNHDDALATAAECAQRFPTLDAPHVVHGEIRVERYLRDLSAGDAVLAQSALAKALRLNASNVRASLLLAQLHYLVGDLAQCRRHLRALLAVNPSAADVQEFLSETDSAPDADSRQTFAELAQAVEEAGAFASPPELFPSLGRERCAPARAPIGAGVLREDAALLAHRPGVRNALVLDRAGAAGASAQGAGALPEPQFERMVLALEATCDDACHRMDAGAMVRAEVECPSGSVTVARVRGLTVAVLYGAPQRPDRVWETIQDLLARRLACGREAARA